MNVVAPPLRMIQRAGRDVCDGVRLMRADECLEEVRQGVGPAWKGRPLYGASRSGLTPAKEAIGKQPERYKAIEPGTVFYNPMRILLGSIAMLDDGEEPGITSPDYVVVRGRHGVLHHRVFYYWLRSAAGEHLIRELARGGVRERILFNRLCEGFIPVPPWSVQERLAEQLAIVPRARAAAAQRLAAAEAIPAALLREVFERPDASGWERLPIAQLGDPSRGDAVQTGPFGAQLPSSEFVREGVPVLNIGNVKDGQLMLRRLDYVTPAKAEDLARYRLRPGDMLFTRSGSVGRSAIVTPECDGWLMSYHLLRVAFDQSRVVPGFVSAAVRGDPLVLKQVRSAAGRGATRDGVNATILGDLVVPAPEIAIQHRVLATLSARLSSAEALIARCRQELADIEALPAALLRAAFNGAP